MSLELFTATQKTPASDVKKLGWRGVMLAVRRFGKVVVTNHNQPEAVILSIAEYQAMALALRALEERNDSALETLRERFDLRLAALEAPDAGERLRAAMDGAISLDGQVKAGASY